MAKLTSKKKRAALLAQQDDKCALCNVDLSGYRDACYDETRNSFLCRPCSIFLHACANSFERNVTLEMLIEYMEQKPQAPPVLKSDRRVCVEEGSLKYNSPDGRRPYTDWDEAVKYHPEWGLVEERLNS